MLGRTKAVLYAAGLLLIIGVACACAQATPAAAPATVPAGATPPPAAAPTLAHDPSVLTVALTADISAVEFPYAAETNSQNAARTLYDSLLMMGVDGSMEPALAETWEVSEDGKSCTFHLRHDVTFQNGEPFNADAVVFTWNTYRQKGVPFAAYFTAANAVEKIDDYTVRVTTEEPTALLLPYIAVGWTQIAPRYYQQVGAAAFAEHPVGTGPFMFKEWVKNDHLTVIANPNYWRKGYPRVQTVVFKFVPESAARVEGLKRGELDIISRLSPSEGDALTTFPGAQVNRYLVDRVYYVAFNNRGGYSGPILDKRVRQAMNYAVDRAGITKSLLEGSDILAAGLVGSADLGWDGAPPFAYDPDRARALLTEAGYSQGFTVDMACPNRAFSHFNEVCEAIARYLDKVGIQVNLQLIESSSFWDMEEKGELPPLFADSWASPYREAYNRLQGALTDEGTYVSWIEPDLQARIKQIGRTVDRQQRAELYRQLQQAMRDDPPFIYLYYPETFEAVSTRVTGYWPGAAEEYTLWQVELNGAK